MTVQLLLIISILLNLDTTQINYTAVFVHAPIDCLMYVECPKGFMEEGQVWKLKKSLYGLAQSPRNHFLSLNGQALPYYEKQYFSMRGVVHDKLPNNTRNLNNIILKARI